jgi:hypothetical protein
MRNGNINCKCGMALYIQTSMNVIECPRCRAKHDVSHIPNEPDVIEVVDPLEEKKAAVQAEIEAAVYSIIAKMQEGD